MDKADIAEFRKWHRDAAIRAKRAGFNIIYVYAGHDMTLLQHFMLHRYNNRTDEYGGSFENRLRLFREVLADTRDAVGDTCAIAIRFAVEEFLGKDGLQHDGEGRDVVAALADEPDLWDVNLSNWSNDSQTARFSPEGFQEDFVSFVKPLTSKPVVGVGRVYGDRLHDGARHGPEHAGGGSEWGDHRGIRWNLARHLLQRHPAYLPS